MKKPLILLSNDDGIQSPGLKALCQALLPLGEVVVVAPEIERSAMGHAITLSDPLRVTEVDLGIEGVTAYSCSGTPADCVKLAILSILPEKPVLVASGINQGSNTGVNVIYSGTVSAATEGAILGIPAVAFSINSRNCRDFAFAGNVAYQISLQVMVEGIPDGTLLNVNIPEQPDPARIDDYAQGKGYSLTVHGKSDWQDCFDKRVDPNNRTYYWLSGRKRVMSEADNTDEETMKAGRVSITPIGYDLTNQAAYKEISGWDLFKKQ
ncbi:5'/3'-nucleotidase SurE [Candidatus Neomarinimicrobiota bacterium]